MRGIFLGRPIHWLIVIGLVILGWLAGVQRLHVTDFNSFMLILIALTMVAVIAVLFTSPEGRAITRDPIEDSGDDTGPAGD